MPEEAKRRLDALPTHLLDMALVAFLTAFETGQCDGIGVVEGRSGTRACLGFFKRVQKPPAYLGSVEPRNRSWTRPRVRLIGWLPRSNDAAGRGLQGRRDKGRRTIRRAIGRVAVSPNGWTLSKVR